MKVLDLGCHDGFIASWVGRQIDGIHIDGIDANSHAVAEFNRRAKLHGIPGEAKVGLAEDAPILFEQRSYDAVVAFEIIEHVEDVDTFLHNCETMLKPGGVLYVSTPDGTFGAGQNPHHLRVYRSIDLCEILRRRGELVDARSGPDGLSFVAYKPRLSRKLEMAIYTGPAWKPWHPINMESAGGLGGSETAAARLAEQYSEMFNVTIYGEFAEQGMFGQVALRHHSLYDPTVPVDTLIVSRRPDLIDADPIANVKLLWMHDTDYGDMLTQERGEKFDKILCLSHWHLEHLEDMYPWIGPRLHRVANGIHPPYFDGLKDDRPREKHSAIFTSSPDRGLDFLLMLWPRVVERVPDAVLHYCYADVYDAVAASGQRPEVAAHQQLCRNLAEELGDGAVNLGALPQPALVKVMSEMSAWLHPSWNSPSRSPFHETFCIGAVESMLAGCARVVSGWGALTERAPEGNMASVISGPGLDEDLWVDAIVDALTEEERLPLLPAEPFGWRAARFEFDAAIRASRCAPVAA